MRRSHNICGVGTFFEGIMCYFTHFLKEYGAFWLNSPNQPEDDVSVLMIIFMIMLMLVMIVKVVLMLMHSTMIMRLMTVLMRQGKSNSTDNYNSKQQ